MNEYIKVSYKHYTTRFSIAKILNELKSRSIMSLDFEMQSVYSLEDRAETKELIKKHIDEMTKEDIKFSKLVARSSGLSNPRLTKITHVIFGLSNKESVILIVNNPVIEQLILDWIVQYPGKLIIHNSLFDLKTVYHRTNRIPIDFIDTQLLAKSLINHTENWKCKVGLKDLMGPHYDPKWTMIESYDIQDFKDENFLRYCSIDGAATFKLYEELQEHLNENT